MQELAALAATLNVRRPGRCAWLPWLCIALLLGGCAETRLVAHTVKGLRHLGGESEQAEGGYKLGEPYQVAGVWYYPKVDYDYQETGIASWYGPRFHGKPTANGEVFDQDGLTAAHRTLPLPSMVRVTNLENGRSIRLRVNDRGPFAPGRIIDVSRRAARLLGFEAAGTAKVRVRVIEDESRRLAAASAAADAAARPQAAPVIKVSSTPMSDAEAVDGKAPDRPLAAGNGRARPGPSPPQPDGRITYAPVEPSEIFVQAGSFLRYDNANRLRARLSEVAPTRVAPAEVREQRFFRVRLGPVASVAEADRLLQVLMDQGYTDARVVVD